MIKSADLHIHTHYSDSTSSPEEVIEQAHRNNIQCIAITDHDTLDGIVPTVSAAQKYDIEVIPGVELSTEANGKDVHMLAYLFDCENEQLKAQLKRMQSSRLTRMQKMIDKLKGLGVDGINLEEVTVLAKSDSVGRPHLASVLVEKGIVANIRQAFDKYLADDAPAYVGKQKQSPVEAIELIRQAGGISVLAHPMFTKVDELIPGFVRAGLGGMEVYYPNCADNVRCFYKGLAEKHGLIMTGGSDAHGDAKKHTYIGKLTVPYSVVEGLKQAVLKNENI